MTRVFVTGSTDGLGKMAAELLIEQGHKVVLHARSAARAEETRKKVAGAEHIVVGDLSSIAATKSVADQVKTRRRLMKLYAADRSSGANCLSQVARLSRKRTPARKYEYPSYFTADIIRSQAYS